MVPLRGANVHLSTLMLTAAVLGILSSPFAATSSPSPPPPPPVVDAATVCITQSWPGGGTATDIMAVNVFFTASGLSQEVTSTVR